MEKRFCFAAFVAALLALGSAVVAADAPGGAAKSPQPRAARSVHLWYPAPEGGSSAFYIEAKVTRCVPGSYFMAAGFSGGYFGVQELGDGRKVVLFSVWDPTRGDDPRAVPPEKRVEVLYKHDEVEVRRFGGEGTGGQCFYRCDWQIDQTLRFLVRSWAHEGNKTAFAGYFHDPIRKQWVHLVTFRTASEAAGRDAAPGTLRGLYSFVEDFRRDRVSATQVRRASFGNVWVQDAKGIWHAARRARFTASSSQWEAKESIDAGVDGQWFYLQTGGETIMSRPLNSSIRLPEAGEAPELPTDLPPA